MPYPHHLDQSTMADMGDVPNHHPPSRPLLEHPTLPPNFLRFATTTTYPLTPPPDNHLPPIHHSATTYYHPFPPTMGKRKTTADTALTYSIPDQSAPSTSHNATDPNYLPPAARQLMSAGQHPPIIPFDFNAIMHTDDILDPRSGLPLPPRPNPNAPARAVDGPPTPRSPFSLPQKVDSLFPDYYDDDDKPAPGHIPRPPNKFILFRRDYLTRIASLGLDKERTTTLTAGVGDIWKNASNGIQNHYKHLAQLAKEAHYLKYPDYKYQPKSKAQKQKEAQAKAEEMRKLREQKRLELHKSLHGGNKNDDAEYVDGVVGPSTRKRKASGSRKSSGGSVAATPGGPPLKRGFKRISASYAPFNTGGDPFKYYPPSAFGPSRRPSDSHDATIAEDEEKHSASQEQPRFTPQDRMYQPPVFSNGSEREAWSSRQQNTLPAGVPSSTAQTPTPQSASDNMWPSMEQGVAWSQSAPVSVPSWGIQPSAKPDDFMNWKAAGPSQPEVELQLSSEGLGLTFHGPRQSLSPTELVSALNLGSDGTIAPSAMHTPTPPMTTGALAPEHVPLSVTFNHTAMNSMLGSLAQSGDGAETDGGLPDMGSSIWDGIMSALANTDEQGHMQFGSGENGIHIQGMSMDTYGHLTDSTGLGAAMNIPSFTEALGYNYEAPAEQEGDAEGDMSFNSMISFGTDPPTKVEEPEEHDHNDVPFTLPTPPADFPKHPPSPLKEKNMDILTPPPPYSQLTTPRWTPARRAAGTWPRSADAAHARSVSVQSDQLSLRSAIVHDVPADSPEAYMSEVEAENYVKPSSSSNKVGHVTFAAPSIRSSSYTATSQARPRLSIGDIKSAPSPMSTSSIGSPLDGPPPLINTKTKPMAAFGQVYTPRKPAAATESNA